jgi:hypothetical protein
VKVALCPVTEAEAAVPTAVTFGMLNAVPSVGGTLFVTEVTTVVDVPAGIVTV